ncbi:MAG TPA: ABC transporter substrate-binding protein [Pseudonocardia sp.]|uniref:ABC transporter substrate-binding protein n=1 Tax=Pseudonocardia sp. TaxID=60912 RepID=UPI002CD57772|nr:ABC transporter substrate-binding protein [Pseudonocardia sp.]HTF48178.1 ABC transporter substrate-binding protein [Pseudonocardia sp.]
MARSTARIPALLGAALVLLLLLSGCMASRTRSGISGAGKDPSSIVVAVPTLAPSFAGQDGGNALTAEAYEINANTQATLVRNPYVPAKTPGTVTQDFNSYTGYLADSYTVSPDGKTYTFHLRENLLSQAGDPLTADDVLWSFERKFASPTGNASAYGPAFTNPKTQLRKLDQHTVAFTLTEAGYGFTFLGLLANLNGHIYDSTFLKQHAAPDDPYAINWSKTHSDWGFGAYSIRSVTPGQEMVLSANPHFVFGEPSIKTITLRVVPDAGTRASLLIRGDVDLAESIRPIDQKPLAAVPGVTVPEVDNPIEFVDLTLVTNKPPFDNEVARQAMAWAVPYDQIIEQIYADRATRMVGSVNPRTKGYSTDGLPVYQYDPDRAKQLLAQAGHPDGLTFDLTVANTVPDLIDAAVLMKSYAAAAGITINVVQQSAAAFAQGRQLGSFQALMYRNRSQTQSPTYALTIFWRPHNNTANPSRWENQAFYDAVNAGIAQTDPLDAVAGHYWNQAMAIELNSAPEIFIANLQPSQAYRSTVHGYTYRSENAVDFANLKFSSP